METGAINRLLRADNIFRYDGDPVADAKAARETIDTFNRVNDIIRTPANIRRSTADILHESYTANLKILTHGLSQKGLKVNLSI